ncbi:MAG: UxaA family hydrolase [Bilophila wadsworthia]
MQKILRIDPKDNLIVALRDLAQGDIIENDGQRIQLVTDVPAKHKFTGEPVPVGGIVTLYGVPVGKAVAPLQSGERITVDNVVHYAAEVDLSDAVPYMWKVRRPAGRTARSTA